MVAAHEAKAAHQGPWRPRSSGVGSYMACRRRAQLDWLWHTKPELFATLHPDVAEVYEADKVGSPYADLGTVGHFLLQSGIKAKFPGPADDFKYTPEQLANAAVLFNHDKEKCIRTAHATASRAARRIEKELPGVRFTAEDAHELPYLTGHIDLTSLDNRIVVDLKTTTKKPAPGRPKWDHFVQLCCYHLFTGCEKAYLLYVDSLKGEWDTWVPINFKDRGVAMFVEQVREFAIELTNNPQTPTLPNLSGGCDWCKHTGICVHPLQDAVNSNPQDKGMVSGFRTMMGVA